MRADTLLPHAEPANRPPRPLVAVELDLPAVPLAAAHARQAVLEATAHLPVDRFAVAVAVSEVVTNAVIHGFHDREPGRVQVHAVLEDAALRVTVGDDGGGLRPRPDSPGLGLGLPLVAQLATSLEVAPGVPAGTRIVMRFALLEARDGGAAPSPLRL